MKGNYSLLILNRPVVTGWEYGLQESTHSDSIALDSLTISMGILKRSTKKSGTKSFNWRVIETRWKKIRGLRPESDIRSCLTSWYTGRCTVKNLLR